MDVRSDLSGSLLFDAIARLGIATKWAVLQDPEAKLQGECQHLASDAAFMAALTDHLKTNPIIEASTESMLAQLLSPQAFAGKTPLPSSTHYRGGAGTSAGGFRPSYYNGPLGRLLKNASSPLGARLRGPNNGPPLLSDARDAFNHETFRRLRNGFGYWSFQWVDRPPSAEIKVVNWETGTETARLSLLECEGLHHLTVSVVAAIDRNLFAARRHARIAGAPT